MKTRPKSRLSGCWLTSGCISACISASCTAFGTWNRSISSIILEWISPPFVRRSLLQRYDFKPAEMSEAQIWGDLATSPMTSFIPATRMSARWCDQFGDGGSTTHFRVGGSKAEVRGPERDGLEWRKKKKERTNSCKLENLYNVWINELKCIKLSNIVHWRFFSSNIFVFFFI